MSSANLDFFFHFIQYTHTLYLRNMHLLLIEDDQGIIIPLQAYLEQSGHTISLCSN